MLHVKYYMHIIYKVYRKYYINILRDKMLYIFLFLVNLKLFPFSTTTPCLCWSIHAFTPFTKHF